jgi:hypothetical protein
MKYILIYFSFQFSLDKVNAEEFLEVYKGVVHEYPVNNSLLFFSIILEYLYS